MSELAGWAIVLGLALIIACMFTLQRQLDRQALETAQAILRSNEMVLARLRQCSPGTPQAAEFIVGMVLDPPRPSTAGQRKNWTNSSTTGPGTSSAR